MNRNKIFWNVVKDEEENTAEITLYGSIGSDECSDDVVDKHIRKTLNSLKDTSSLKVYINSPGGSVSAATAIYNALKNHKANVEIHIDGLAASAATIIACAGDKVFMPNNALFMIHNPWTVAAGDSNELNKTADVLQKFKTTIINTYVKKTGLDEETLSQLMDAETWLTAEEAMEYNFIDEISQQESKIENYGNRLIVNNLSFDIGKFKNSPFKNVGARNFAGTNGGVNMRPPTPKPQIRKPNNQIENKEEIMDKVELKEKHPEIYNEIYNEGIESERERLKNIEENAPTGFDDLVLKAKFEEPMNYETLAVNILREQQEREKVQNKINSEKLAAIQIENGEGLEHMKTKEPVNNKDESIAKNILGFIPGGK